MANANSRPVKGKASRAVTTKEEPSAPGPAGEAASSTGEQIDMNDPHLSGREAVARNLGYGQPDAADAKA